MYRATDSSTKISVFSDATDNRLGTYDFSKVITRGQVRCSFMVFA